MKLDFLKEFDFFAGVPDSQLKPLCDWLMSNYGISKNHKITANEGNAVALAAGYHLATGKVPVVYMQNSGIGNAINPIASLMHDKVYGIPCVFVVGWRGEPNVHDEPQHVFQGEITLKLFEDLGVKTFVIDKNTPETEVKQKLDEWKPLLKKGKQVAFVVRKGALEYGGEVKYQNGYDMSREEIIKHIVAITDTDPVVSTTGKASRELFEIREEVNQGHSYDFLTVGSMGHTSSIALQIANEKQDKKIWCIDGDGSVLMHMGAMALVGSEKPKNLVHIVINNGSHETVGGMPTVANNIDLINIAKGCGYPYAVSVSDYESLDKELESAKQNKGLKLIEVKCSIGARANLGRPTTTPKENKENFMNNL